MLTRPPRRGPSPPAGPRAGPRCGLSAASAPGLLSAKERSALEALARRRKTSQALALRARIVLALAAGASATAVAASWRSRGTRSAHGGPASWKTGSRRFEVAIHQAKRQRRDVTCAGRCLLSGGFESGWFPGVPFAAAAMDRGRESWVRRAGRPLVKPVILGHRTLHREATGRTMHACAGAGRAGDCARRTRVPHAGR